MGVHLAITITDTTLTIARDQASIDAEAAWTASTSSAPPPPRQEEATWQTARLWVLLQLSTVVAAAQAAREVEVAIDVGGVQLRRQPQVAAETRDLATRHWLHSGESVRAAARPSAG